MIFERRSSFLWWCTLATLLGISAILFTISAAFVTGTLNFHALSEIENPPHPLRVSWLDSQDAHVEHEKARLPERITARGSNSTFIRSAFILQTVDRDPRQLIGALNNLDIAFPNWFAWTDWQQGLHEDILPDYARVLRESGTQVEPLISNADSLGKWHAKEVSELLRDNKISQQLINQLHTRIQAIGAAGINVDFENLTPQDSAFFADWIGRLSRDFHALGLKVTVDVPLDDPAYDYVALANFSDAVVIMAYDQHAAASEPGPVAGLDWFNEKLTDLLQKVPPQKTIVALGAYGYDWDVSSGEPATSLSFDEVMELADATDGGIETDPDSLNSHFSFTESDGDEHEVWFLDAVSAWDQYIKTRRLGVLGVGVWHLGSAENVVWDFLSLEDPKTFDASSLANVVPSHSIMVEGDGEVYRISGSHGVGKRELTFNDEGIDYSAYIELPKFVTLTKEGRQVVKTVALTFDDGPDPVWTPKLLDLLKQSDTHATFFVVGDRAQQHLDLVRREYEEGHLLGNHTFTHPHLETVSDLRLNFELNATQRMIEAATGRSTNLFRLPYDANSTPDGNKKLKIGRNISNLNYQIVGADVDSKDTEPISANRIEQNVLNGLETTQGNIIVFHDAGKRQSTLEAVSRLIPELKGRGYNFVTVDSLLEQSRDAVMPTVPSNEEIYVLAGKIFAQVRSVGGSILWYVLFTATGIAIVRLLGISSLLAHSVSSSRRRQMPDVFSPPVVVVIPAFNEAKVIATTLKALLQSEYPHFRVILVDDGSTDDTALIAEEFSKRHPQISVIRKKNEGKYTALNLAFSSAKEDYVITIDADTIVMPDTLRQLILPFADSNVDAVCGNVLVGNVNNLLTTFQDVEYTTTQNFDRRAFETLNCITVVPGATGAWKRLKIVEIGGYSGDTLTEDADLSISLLRNGGTIAYAPLGRSITEAPENASAWFKQRFRWRFGMFQCLWKHRGSFGKGYLGCIALPNIFVQMLLELLSPICDLILCVDILSGHLKAVSIMYLVYLLADITTAAAAFLLDRRRLVNLVILVIQRFFYRPLLYFVTFTAVGAVGRGRRFFWNKLERAASVTSAVPSWNTEIQAVSSPPLHQDA